MDNKEETKTEAPSKGLKYTPRQYAVCSLFLCVIVVLLLGALLSNAIGDVGSHIGIAAGGITGVVLYLLQERSLHLKEQLRSFDVTVPMMILLLNWTGCTLASSVYGMIAADLSSVTPHESHMSLVMRVIGSGIVAPIGEELMFRLCGMGLMKKCYGRAFTILFPTVVFSLMHAFYGIQGLVEVFVGTIFFAVCYYFTENILYTIIAHMLHNFLCIPKAISDLSYTNNGYGILRPVPFAVYLILFAAGMVWLFTAFRKRYISSAK